MTKQKQRSAKPSNAPNNEAAPPRREDHSQQRSNKVDPRGSNQTPQGAPTGKRSDQEDFDAPTTEKRDPQKGRQEPDSGRRK